MSSVAHDVRLNLDLFGNDDWYDPSAGIYKHYTQTALIETAAFGFSPTYGPADAPFVGLGEMYGLVNGELNIPPPDDLTTLLGNSVRAIVPGIKAELSLVNSLYELKDMKSLLRTAQNLGRQINVLDATLRMQRRSILDTIGDTRRLAADLYLQYKFNLAPLLSDAKGLVIAFRSFQARARKLASQAEMRRTRHFTCEVVSESGGNLLPSGPIIVLNNGSLHGEQGRRWEVPVSKFHVEMQYSYYYTVFQQQHAAGLALMDVLGVNKLPKIIWNALPWSFVLDWVLNVSKYLDQLLDDHMKPVVLIHRSLWSYRKLRTVERFVVTESQGELPLSSVVEEAYSRNLFTPSSDWIESSGLSSSEFSLIAALAGSRR